MRMKPPSPINTPAPVPRVGPNWKLIRNLFIIAGLLIAISITWDLRHQARLKRERDNRRIIEKQAAAREKAMAEAREKAEAAIRKREAEMAAALKREDPAIHSEPRPPVEKPSESTRNSTSNNSFKNPVKTEEPELPAEIANLNTKAKDLVAAAGRKRDEQLAANAKKLSWDLDLYLRSLPKSEQNYWMPHVNVIKNSIQNNRAPESLLQSNDFDMSKKMEELAEYAVTKQKQIDQGFLADAAKIQSAYLRKVGDAAAQAGSSGNKALAELLNRTSANAANLDSWIRTLGVDEASP